MNFKGFTLALRVSSLVLIIFSISQASEITSNPNLISNSSFEIIKGEEESPDWMVTTKFGEVLLDNENSFQGETSLRLSNSRRTHGKDSNDGYIIIRQNVSLLPGKTYTLSAMMKTENLTKPGSTWIGVINDGWTWSKRISAADKTGKWRRVTISFTPIPSPSYQVVIVLEPNISGKVWFDSIQLEEGDKASEYRFTGIKKSDNWFRIDDPLFEELLTQEPGTSHPSPVTYRHSREFKDIPYWGYNNDEELFRSYALKHAHRWSLAEQYEEMRRYHLIPMKYPELSQKYGVKFMMEIGGSGGAPPVIDTEKGKVPWLLDPEVEKGFLSSAERVMSQWNGKGLWGVFTGDELYSQATRVVPKESRYAFVKEADKEIKKNYGFGKYSMPESPSDSNPFRWIAYKRWVAEKMKGRYAKLYSLIKAKNPEILIVSTDPIASVPPDDYSGFGPYVDIVVGQAINDIRTDKLADKLRVGYATKCLVDLSGRPVYTTVQVCDYLGSPTPEHIRERMSQVFRNGGSGIFLLAVEWFDRELNHHKYAYPQRWKALLEICDHIRNMNRVKIPQDPDMAIIYSSDSLSSSPYSPLPPEMLSSYAILGPLNGAWFEFIDERQLERAIKSLKDYKVLVVPYAKYERSSVIQMFLDYAVKGGLLLCTDPEAFSWDLSGKAMDDAREKLFGVKQIRKRVKIQKIRWVGSKLLKGVYDRELSTEDPGFNVSFTDKDVHPLAFFEDNTPSIIMKKIGKGGVIYFSFNPFNIKTPEDIQWVNLFGDILKAYKIKLKRDIWRFKFPPFRTIEPISSPGKCLTNNNIVFEENIPLSKDNLMINGTYSFSPLPDSVPDKSIREIPFSTGHLTDRKKAAYRRVLGRWVGAVDPKPWVVAWKTARPFEIIFDLTEPHSLDRARLFYTGELPPVEVEGSKDSNSWEKLASSAQALPTLDVLDKSYSLKGGWQYIKFSFGERPQKPNRPIFLDKYGNNLTLAEIEIWGE